ncbi:hypothetical protein [Mesorhizobium sp. ES1-1]|uniref:hypothetical protein n=1 Tax=Mesorhizobium sp. ES1-1 TaxID=2876629 RepID=UPI001CC99045|nr:hypothetical protein [Mesorhizobium sp. ES1-1]MBZ9674842.1 hypothetical protein [Mesorhizobium sp. ES1-1]
MTSWTINSTGSTGICPFQAGLVGISSAGIRSGHLLVHPDAREAISRARYCAWLIEEGGLPVRPITSTRHREILWRDAHQIVAKPTDDLPKAFG